MSLTLPNNAFAQVAAQSISKAESEGGKYAKGELEQGMLDLVELSAALSPEGPLNKAFQDLRVGLDSRHSALYGALSAIANVTSVGESELQTSARKLKSLDASKVGMSDQTSIAQWGGLQAISKMAASIEAQTLSKLCGSNASAGAIFIALDTMKPTATSGFNYQDQPAEDFYNK